ncbi:MAG: Zn-dependent exopeptidase M28 [Bacteroidales bacterium]|nr:Zn-dependent exopeptidase M28 [Bacteroidales bacterium]
MMKRISFIPILLMSVFYAFAQDMDYTNLIVNELSSPKYFGRGYVNKGDSLASVFLAGEFEKMNLQKYENSFFQTYYTNINRYIQKPIFFFGDKELVVAKDFISIPDSKELKGKYKIEWISADVLKNQRALKHMLKQDHTNSFICIDTTGLDNEELFNFANTIFSENFIGAAGIIETSPRLKYTARTKIEDFVHLQIKPESVDYQADSVYVDIKNDFIENYETQNVIAYIKGKSDSIVMFTAHYDHLGMIGDIMYPGANDNASGVSMVLNLAKYFSQKRKPEFTMVFALFSGEEAGLLGSTYMADNPPFELSKVKFLVNFDMIGTGDDGIYMLNAKEYPDLDTLIIQMNQKEKYFDVMHSSHVTYSSDHAPFYDKGVDAIFIYAAGNNQNYHQPQDKIVDLTYAEYKDIFRFCLDLVKVYSK